MDQNNNTNIFSKYAMSLHGAQKVRYEQKIAAISFDQYLGTYDEQELPDNQLKAFKSLDSYELYKGGWVQFMAGKAIQNGFVVFEKVLHTQSLNLPALEVWIHLHISGSINTAHCTCVAGLGECCKHIGAVLFALHAIYINILDSGIESVTDKKALWVVPSCKLSVQLCNENITYASATCTKLEFEYSTIQNHTSTTEIKTILGQILATGRTPVVSLALNEYLPAVQDTDFELDNLLDDLWMTI